MLRQLVIEQLRPGRQTMLKRRDDGPRYRILQLVIGQDHFLLSLVIIPEGLSAPGGNLSHLPEPIPPWQLVIFNYVQPIRCLHYLAVLISIHDITTLPSTAPSPIVIIFFSPS